MTRALIAVGGGRGDPCCRAGAAARAGARKHVLAWADVRNGYQHDSISHAVATIERLGRESGAYDTFIRTDSQLITKHPITFPAGTGIATGEQFNVRNLELLRRDLLLRRPRDRSLAGAARRSAVVREGRWQGVRRRAFGGDRVLLVAGVRRDARRPLRRASRASPTARSSSTMPAFPAMRICRAPVFHDELYQIKDFSRDKIRIFSISTWWPERPSEPRHGRTERRRRARRRGVDEVSGGRLRPKPATGRGSPSRPLTPLRLAALGSAPCTAPMNRTASRDVPADPAVAARRPGGRGRGRRHGPRLAGPVVGRARRCRSHRLGGAGGVRRGRPRPGRPAGSA